jgi:uncharacterized membrane protein YhaH (DUF805 family)
MNLINQFKTFIKNTGNIKIITTRKEFWIQSLIYWSIAFTMQQVSPLIFSIPFIGFLLFYIPFIYIQFGFVCLSIRRLHDSGFSGWWTILYILGCVFTKNLDQQPDKLIPIAIGALTITFIPIFILWLQPSKNKNNKYIS